MPCRTCGKAKVTYSYKNYAKYRKDRKLKTKQKSRIVIKNTPNKNAVPPIPLVQPLVVADPPLTPINKALINKSLPNQSTPSIKNKSIKKSIPKNKKSTPKNKKPITQNIITQNIITVTSQPPGLAMIKNEQASGTPAISKLISRKHHQHSKHINKKPRKILPTKPKAKTNTKKIPILRTVIRSTGGNKTKPKVNIKKHQKNKKKK